MKTEIKINKEVIKALTPCTDRYENYLKHYSNFEGNLADFFDLKEISHHDKLWVSLRILPKEMVEVFAIDCAVSAFAYAANSAAHYAANSAAHAANSAANSANYAAYSAAYSAADYAAERERQLEALIYLAGNQ